MPNPLPIKASARWRACSNGDSKKFPRWIPGVPAAAASLSRHRLAGRRTPWTPGGSASARLSTGSRSHRLTEHWLSMGAACSGTDGLLFNMDVREDRRLNAAPATTRGEAKKGTVSEIHSGGEPTREPQPAFRCPAQRLMPSRVAQLLRSMRSW